MRIIKNPEERRNEILNAAEALFVSKGYTKTTIIDILQAVKIAKGTFYHYFQSKEEVMNAIVMRFIAVGVNAAKRIAEDDSLDAHTKIFNIITAQGQDVGNKEQFIEELHQVHNVEMHQKSLVETILQLSPILTEVIEQGIREGVFHTPRPREVVEFLLVSSQFLLDQGIFQWTEEELQRKVEAFMYILECTLGAEKGSFSYIIERYRPNESN
ncbi:TetR/AcrR family transcriptional regulator [Paenibacillus tundrae]|uniref:AcrR family transcriptional regulator n=1 Tax=Paenibacillus tundrae TaxID=528187 RepID=A0ABT9W8X0_9BACL|nr:TetR/AcrR family transcriptional regulator [Paenibacillus tundrae]MDQ0169692.1 AcrR family transcriptional regulator [Paenibacillus tundrae]